MFNVSFVGAAPFSTVTLQVAFLLLKVFAVRVAVPALTPRTLPAPSTVTTLGLLLVHVMADAVLLGSLAVSFRASSMHSTRVFADSVTFDGALRTVTLQVTFTPL